ncbi:glycosyl hydrolase family 18 protein [Bacteroidota bacterium]
MRKEQFFLLASSLLIIFSVFMFSCEDDSVDPDQIDTTDVVINYLKEPVCTESFTPKTYTTQVVGFYPSYRHDVLPVENIQWDKITRIIYAFANPYANGTLNTSDLTQMSTMVETAHENGVEVYVSVGGGGQGENFPIIATNETVRTRFVNEVREYVFANCLDGVDLDWEYWTGSATNTVIPAESNGVVTILKDLKAELEPFDLEISVDVGGSNWGGRHFYDDVAVYSDYIMVMCYDFSGPWSGPGPHSSFEQSIGSGDDVGALGLAYWVNYREFPKEKVMLGVPFYGRDFDIGGGEGVTYANIVNEYPEAPNKDQVDNIYYNGIETMARKTQYVLDNAYGGVMIWELGQDVGPEADSISLLNAIHTTIYPE